MPMCQSPEREFALQQNMEEVQIGITRQNRNEEELSYFIWNSLLK